MESFFSVDERPVNILEERTTNKMVARLEPTVKNQRRGEEFPSLLFTSRGKPNIKVQRGEPVIQATTGGQTSSEKEGDFRRAKTKEKRKKAHKKTRGGPQKSGGAPGTAPCKTRHREFPPTRGGGPWSRVEDTGQNPDNNRSRRQGPSHPLSLETM